MWWACGSGSGPRALNAQGLGKSPERPEPRAGSLSASARWTGRREIPLARAHARALEIGARQLDFDLAPDAVDLLIRGHVPEAVLRGDLGDHLRIHVVELLERGREERLPAGCLGDLLQAHLLLDAIGRPLVLQEAHRVDRHIRRLDQVEHVAEA